MRHALGISSVLLIAACALIAHAEPPKAQDKVREEASKCASLLRQFGIGWAITNSVLEDKKKTGEPDDWPPPPSWSWRVTVLPFMEQNVLYMSLHRASDEFKIPGSLSDKELDKHKDLKRAVAEPPEWMTIERWKRETGKTIYRRVVVVEKPELFIVVESSELVPWFRGDDDLVMDAKNPLPKMGGNFQTGFFALCGDGEVRFLPKTLSDKETRKALLTGEGVPALRFDSKNTWQKDIAKLDLGK
jgi:hypothetical protein